MSRVSYSMLFYGLPVIAASLIVMSLNIADDVQRGATGLHLIYAPMLENVLISLFFLVCTALIIDINSKRNQGNNTK